MPTDSGEDTDSRLVTRWGGNGDWRNSEWEKLGERTVELERQSKEREKAGRVGLSWVESPPAGHRYDKCPERSREE